MYITLAIAVSCLDTHTRVYIARTAQYITVACTNIHAHEPHATIYSREKLRCCIIWSEDVGRRLELALFSGGEAISNSVPW